MILYVIRLALAGKFRRIFAAIHRRLYIALWNFRWMFRGRGHRSSGTISVITNHTIAHDSPDHLHPKGAASNNSTNRAFLLRMDQLIPQSEKSERSFMDLGCSGGQLVADFREFGWISVGIEGSNTHARRRTANWPNLGGKNLFTSDITQPFTVVRNGSPIQFDLITAWEVLEHIAEEDLQKVFLNIRKHLAPGGLFIATTTETSDIHDGVELHQTRWAEWEWQKWIAVHQPDFRRAHICLPPHHCVRWNFDCPSLLVYRRSK